MTAYDDALAIGVKMGWIALPLLEREGRWIPPFSYTDLLDEPFDVALFEKIWRGYEEAVGLGVVWPADIVAIDVDSPEAEEWLRHRKPPRTPTFNSARGPHLLYRGDGEGLDPQPFPQLEVLSRASGKRLLVLPPTPGKVWRPSLGLYDLPFAPLPDAFKNPAPLGDNGRRERVKISGEAFVEGGRNTPMASIVGQLVAAHPPEEALALALAYDAQHCDPPLGEKRIRRMVEDFVAKDRGRSVLAVVEPVPSSSSSLPWTLPGEEAGADEEEAIVTDILYPGSKTLCISLPKVGKSTFAVGMCAAIRSGKRFLDRAVEPCNILYLTEEPRATFIATLERAGIEEHDPGFQYLRRGMAGVAGVAWPKIVAAVVTRSQDIGAELVVVDVLHRWAGFVDGGENASDKVNEAITELTPLSEAGIAVLILAHSPWGEKRVRGSTDIFGAVDDGWFLNGEAGSSDSRTLQWIGGRHEPKESRSAFQLDAEGRLHYQGNQNSESASKTQAVIDAVLWLGRPCTTAEVAEHLEWNDRTARRWLDRAAHHGFIGHDTGTHAERLWRARKRFEYLFPSPE